MSNMRNSLGQAIDIIDQTTDLFYQQKNEDGYKLLDQVFEKLLYAANEIFNDSIINQNEESKIKFDNLLNNAMETLKRNDIILLSDILQFEIKEFLITHNI